MIINIFFTKCLDKLCTEFRETKITYLVNNIELVIGIFI